MIRTRAEWEEYVFENGTSGEMGFDMLKDWEEDVSTQKQDYDVNVPNQSGEIDVLIGWLRKKINTCEEVIGYATLGDNTVSETRVEKEAYKSALGFAVQLQQSTHNRQSTQVATSQPAPTYGFELNHLAKGNYSWTVKASNGIDPEEVLAKVGDMNMKAEELYGTE